MKRGRATLMPSPELGGKIKLNMGGHAVVERHLPGETESHYKIFMPEAI